MSKNLKKWFLNLLSHKKDNKVKNNSSKPEYKGINVKIQSNEKESKMHLDEDFSVLMNEGIENIIKNNFISWLKGENFKDRDDNKIMEGLELYEITYNYGRIIEKYSPINKEAFFGQFEFCFNSSSEYTEDILEAVAMQVYVYEGKVVKVSGYDI